MVLILNKGFLQQQEDNSITKICPFCGNRHHFDTRKMLEGRYLVQMLCNDNPKEPKKMAANTYDPERFVFLKSHKGDTYL